MNKIIDVEKAEKISKQLQKQNKIVVVSGGCFDILHIGHIRFLEKAKKTGDFFHLGIFLVVVIASVHHD